MRLVLDGQRVRPLLARRPLGLLRLPCDEGFDAQTRDAKTAQLWGNVTDPSSEGKSAPAKSLPAVL
eukprot:4789354-Prymnesium_polylepis.1